MVIALQLWKMFLNLNFAEFFLFAKNNAGTDYSPHCTNPQNRIQRAFETLSCSDFAAPKPAGSFAGGKFWKRSCKEVRRMGRRGFKFKTLTSTKAIPPSTQALTLRCFAKRFYSNLIGRARVAQWWEHPPPTNLAQVRILASTPYVGWIMLLVLSFALRGFSVFRFSPLLKNQHFQIPIRSGTHRHVSTSS